MFFEWSHELSVGNSKIDAQHQILINYINEFYTVVHRDSDNKKAMEIFNKILDYTDFHFTDEEALMEKYNYPGLEEHILLHKELKGQVLYYYEFLKRNDPKVYEMIFLFLKTWLTQHIRHEDMNYKDFIKH